jgi:hypothetical protein
MTEIVWNNGIEPQNKAEIEKYLNPFLFLIPKWCQRLVINVYPSDNGNAIETTTHYDYRWIQMNFFSDWFVERNEVKQEDIIHDLLHGFTSIAIDYAIRQIDNLCPESEAEKFNRSMKEQLTILCESMTQDLAFAIMNKFNEIQKEK